MNANEVSTDKIVVAVNKALEPGVALNAAAHAALGLAGKLALSGSSERLRLLDYSDQDGEPHDLISALSLVVLRGRNTDLRNLRRALRSANLCTVDFTNQMTGETYVEQLARSASTPEAELEYYAVAAFGTAEELNPLTRKLSLWR